VNSFRRGLRNRNPLVLVAALALLVPALLGVQWLFTSGVLRSGEDTFTYTSWVVGKAQHGPTGTPGIYLLGGSSARESIVSGDALAAEIAALGGPRVAAYDLGSSNQTFTESLAVVDSVPDTPAWLIVGVNLGRFTATKEHQYTILPGIRSFVTHWARQHGPALLEGASPSTEYGLHRYSAETRRSDGQKERLVKVWNTLRRPVFEQNVHANLQTLEVLLEHARKRGVRVVLLELPLNEEIVRGRFGAAQRQYQEPARALARKYGVPWVDLNQTLNIPSTDFQDLSHLIAPGRVIWQHALAKQLARLMRSEGSGGSSR